MIARPGSPGFGSELNTTRTSLPGVARLMSVPLPVVSRQCPAVTTSRFDTSVPEQMKEEPPYRMLMLTTPEKSDVGRFGSTRLPAESGGAPATIIGTTENTLIESAYAALVIVNPRTTAHVN